MEIRPNERKIIDLKHPEVVRQEARAAEEAEVATVRPGVVLEWEALEYEFVPKERRWFLWGGGGAVLLMIFGIVTGNFFFSIFVALAIFTVFLYAVRPPKRVSCAVTSEGVRVGGRIYDFPDLRSFWIFYEPEGLKELSLESKRALLPFIRVPLGEMEPVKVRDALIRFIREERHEEGFAESVARLVGF